MQATQTTSIQAKSLTILEDQLQHEFLACKKARFYAQQMQDAQLRGVASQIADAHCQRYEPAFQLFERARIRRNGDEPESERAVLQPNR